MLFTADLGLTTFDLLAEVSLEEGFANPLILSTDLLRDLFRGFCLLGIYMLELIVWNLFWGAIPGAFLGADLDLDFFLFEIISGCFLICSIGTLIVKYFWASIYFWLWGVAVWGLWGDFLTYSICSFENPMPDLGDATSKDILRRSLFICIYLAFFFLFCIFTL